jgi:hypothetical protein
LIRWSSCGQVFIICRHREVTQTKAHLDSRWAFLVPAPAMTILSHGSTPRDLTSVIISM